MAAKLSPVAHKIIRILLLLAIAGGAGLAVHRLRRTPEQVELTRYIQVELPLMLTEQHAVTDLLDELMRASTLPPPVARKRLVDEITPRLVKLRRRAEALAPGTVTVRQLAAQHLQVIDAWTEAARSALRAIDDPKLSTEAGFTTVRERLRDAAEADQAWRARVVETCEHNHLTAPH